MNIIIVDDSPTKVHDIKKSIEYLNANITIVGTGREAMIEIMVEEFDYMISDMQFPWSGSEIEDTCGIHPQQELLDSGVKLPTIICSSVKSAKPILSLFA